MDPLVGEVVAAVRAVELALSKQLSHVIFESDSKVLCSDVSQPLLLMCWKIADLVTSICNAFKGQSAWTIH